jgi:hypothetical protein
MLGDPTKVVAFIANYAFTFTTWIPYLQGEAVFNSAKCNIDYFLRANVDSHRLDHFNFSCLRVWPFPHVKSIMSIICMSISCHVVHIICCL